MPTRQRRLLRLWFLSGALLTFLIIIVGGATRLTESGLSIVQWRPVSGAIPPLNSAEWQAAFDEYKRFPEYRELRRGMSLAEFRTIFLWEYSHRLLARLIGLVFLLPALWFWIKGYLTSPLGRRVMLLFGLGAAQGFVGWFMVRSGLVDDPRVSHYRLALHLFMALTVLGSCLWFAGELTGRRVRPGRAPRPWDAYVVGALLLLQILYGAFVAGLDAGLYFNTFPSMAGRLVPPGLTAMDPPAINFVANPIAVQWVHRLLGTLLLLVAAGAAWRNVRGRHGAAPRHAVLFMVLVGVQYALGILTLVRFVPVGLGVMHQAMAVLIFALWLSWIRVASHAAGRSPLLEILRSTRSGASLPVSERRTRRISDRR